MYRLFSACRVQSPVLVSSLQQCDADVGYQQKYQVAQNWRCPEGVWVPSFSWAIRQKQLFPNARGCYDSFLPIEPSKGKSIRRRFDPGMWQCWGSWAESLGLGNMNPNLLHAYSLLQCARQFFENGCWRNQNTWALHWDHLRARQLAANGWQFFPKPTLNVNSIV